MKILLLCLLMLSALSGEAHAQYSTTQRLVGGASMKLYGLGEYQNLGENIYIGALYVPQLENTIKPGSSKRMEMRIVTESLSARRFTRNWMDAITLSSSRDERIALAAQLQKFGRIFNDDLIRGDKISFDFLGSVGQTVVLINDVQIGAIPGIGFFNILLNAWVGETPLSSELKAGILGEMESDQNILIRRQFAEIEYTEDRHRDIAGKYRR